MLRLVTFVCLCVQARRMRLTVRRFIRCCRSINAPSAATLKLFATSLAVMDGKAPTVSLVCRYLSFGFFKLVDSLWDVLRVDVFCFIKIKIWCSASCTPDCVNGACVASNVCQCGPHATGPTCASCLTGWTGADCLTRL